MWTYNEVTKTFELKEDRLEKKTFNLYREELDSYRFYSKCLKGTCYLPIDSKTDVYKKLKFKNGS